MSENRYVLDTSALTALFADEPGADYVQNILEKAKTGKVTIWISFMTLMEIIYVTWQHKGREVAELIFQQIKKFPVTEVWPNEAILQKSAEIKATHSLSVADAWIAATAMEKEAMLIHKDREFEALGEDLPQLNLAKRR